VGDGLRFAVLGPVRAWYGDAELDLGWPKQRGVLAILLLRPDRTATRAVLVDALWGEDPPHSCANLVHTYVRRLRQVLEPGHGSRQPGRVLVSDASGYALRVAPGQVDLDEFHERVRLARQRFAATDPVGAVGAYDAALGLWPAEPLAGLTGPFADTQRVHLGELRLAVQEERAEAMLAAGWHAALATELPTLVTEHPLRERPRALLMTALYRSDRRAEALEVYAQTRAILVGELGIEPGESLRRLHHDVLNDRDPGPARPNASGLRRLPPRASPPGPWHWPR
jgi:DNA-binding SARP family transcriptional activator